MLDRPYTAFFSAPSTAFASLALRTQGFPTEAIRCLQRKLTGDMLITFANARMKYSFLEKNVMQIRHRHFAINNEDRQLTYLNVYDAPHELSDNALIRHLEPYCEVIHYRWDDILLIDLFSIVTITVEYADMLPPLPICVLANF